MQDIDLIAQCEAFRQSVMLSINAMTLTHRQKQQFLLVFQTFYLQLLQQLNADGATDVADNSN
jgi:hypothetical protein